MRSGRLLVRAAAVAALLVAAIVAVVVLTHAEGSGPRSSARHATAALSAPKQTIGSNVAHTTKVAAKAKVAGKTKVAAKSAIAKTQVVKKTPVTPALHPAKPKLHAALPAPKTTPVAVLNGGTAQGAAAALADRLRSLGYPVPVVGNAGRRDLPMAIEYSAGLGPAARALARHVGSVQFVTPLEGPNRNLSGARLLVIVGD